MPARLCRGCAAGREEGGEGGRRGTEGWLCPPVEPAVASRRVVAAGAEPSAGTDGAGAGALGTDRAGSRLPVAGLSPSFTRGWI